MWGPFRHLGKLVNYPIYFGQQLCCASKWAKMEPMDKNQHGILHKNDILQALHLERFEKPLHAPELMLCAT